MANRKPTSVVGPRLSTHHGLGTLVNNQLGSKRWKLSLWATTSMMQRLGKPWISQIRHQPGTNVFLKTHHSNTTTSKRHPCGFIQFSRQTKSQRCSTLETLMVPYQPMAQRDGSKSSISNMSHLGKRGPQMGKCLDSSKGMRALISSQLKELAIWPHNRTEKPSLLW